MHVVACTRNSEAKLANAGKARNILASWGLRRVSDKLPGNSYFWHLKALEIND